MRADDAEETAIVAAFDQADEVEEEDDPGELVSTWYAMKKAFESTLAALRGAEGELNAIGDRLRTKHGIQVPVVTTYGTGAPVVQSHHVPPPADPAEALPTPADSSWSPPSQAPVSFDQPKTGAHFVEELRRDASAGESEKGFADQIGRMLASFGDFK